MTFLHGRVWTLLRWWAGSFRFGQRILDVQHLTEVPDLLLVPGVIGVHVHGGGTEAMDGQKGIRRTAPFHARHGTTTLLAPPITNSWPHVVEALRATSGMRAPAAGEAAVLGLGAHLEGPVIGSQILWAQPVFTRLPEPGLIPG